ERTVRPVRPVPSNAISADKYQIPLDRDAFIIDARFTRNERVQGRLRRALDHVIRHGCGRAISAFDRLAVVNAHSLPVFRDLESLLQTGAWVVTAVPRPRVAGQSLDIERDGARYGVDFYRRGDFSEALLVVAP